MGIISLLIVVAVFGFVVWIILQIPMPGLVKNIIIGLFVLFLVVWVLQGLGLATGLPTLRLR